MASAEGKRVAARLRRRLLAISRAAQVIDEGMDEATDAEREEAVRVLALTVKRLREWEEALLAAAARTPGGAHEREERRATTPRGVSRRVPRRRGRSR